MCAPSLSDYDDSRRRLARFGNPLMYKGKLAVIGSRAIIQWSHGAAVVQAPNHERRYLCVLSLPGADNGTG